MKKLYLIPASALLVFGAALWTSCSDDDSDSVAQIDTDLNATILNSFSDGVAQASYNDLQTKSATIYTNIQTFATTRNDANLTAIQTSWRAARQAWEQTESFLFGPVSTAKVDPRIDTWPVDFNALEGQLASDVIFDEPYIDNLDEALKGFHPIEYLIFGQNGDKKAADFTDREVEYLTALGLNLKKLTTEVADGWNPAKSGNYDAVFTSAGNGTGEYPTQRAAFEQLVAAMADICGEVSEAKMGEVYAEKDPSLEESPFAKNSITDFTNNIKGVENVYLGKYSADGTGLEDLVIKHNRSLDGKIKTAISAAIQALGKIDKPFGEAIISEAVQVQNAIDATADLKTVLEEELLPFVQAHTK